MTKYFETQISRHGGAVESTAELSFLMPLFSRVEDRIRQAFMPGRGQPPVSFVFAKQMTLGAAALTDLEEKSGQQDVILLRAGLVANLWAVFHVLMAEPYIFQKIGDSSNENAGKYVWSDLTKCFDAVVRHQVFSACNIRKSFALRLCELALDFCVNHELAHIVMGHTRHLAQYSRGKTSACIFDGENGVSEDGTNSKSPCFVGEEEFLAQASQNERALLRQAMEDKADSWSILHTLDSLYSPTSLEWRKTTQPPPVRTSFEVVYEDPLDTLRYLAFAVFISFRIADHPRPNLYRLVTADSATHPPHRFRMLFAMRTVLAAIKLENRYPNLDAVKAEQAMMDSFIVADAACHLLLGRRQGPYHSAESLESIQRPAFQKYERLLHEAYEKVRPNIEACAFPEGALYTLVPVGNRTVQIRPVL